MITIHYLTGNIVFRIRNRCNEILNFKSEKLLSTLIVNDLIGENCRVLFILESPHKKELSNRFPAAGVSGKKLSKLILSPNKYQNIPFGMLLNNQYNYSEIKDRLNKCFLEKANKKYSSLDLVINFESYKKSDFEFLLNKNKVKNKEKILYDIALTNTSRDFLKVPVLKINNYENVKREITYMENLGAISSDLDELDKSKIEDIFSNNIFLLPHDKKIIYDKRDNGEVYIFLSLKNIIFDFLDLNKKQYTFLKDISKLNTVKIDKKAEFINTVNKFNFKSTPEYYQRFILVYNLKSKIIVYIFEAQNKKNLLSISKTISDLHQILTQ